MSAELPVSDAAFLLGATMARSFFAKRQDVPEVQITETDLAAGLATAAWLFSDKNTRPLFEALVDARLRFGRLAFDAYTTNTDSQATRERFKTEAQLGRDAITAVLEAAGVKP